MSHDEPVITNNHVSAALLFSLLLLIPTKLHTWYISNVDSRLFKEMHFITVKVVR